ncbi:hypothetical protein EP342_03655 [bacterium]|nr:MAG: hypothetical protein EP342_03655 [bacterium]
MKKLFQLCLFATFITLFVSCSNDKTTNPGDNPSTTSSFLNTGNWWKYNVYLVDGNGNPLGEPSSNYTDRIIGKVTIGGKEAYILVEEDSDKNLSDSNYIYTDANGIYSYGNEFNSEGTSSWTKLIDFKNTEWDVANSVIDQQDGEESAKGTINKVGKRTGDSKVVYKNKYYDAQNYLNIINTDITVTYFDENGELVTEQKLSSDTTSISFIPNIGFYSSGNKKTENNNGEVIVTSLKNILVDHLVK